MFITTRLSEIRSIVQNLRNLVQVGGFLASGIAIGWLVGLSVSPVVQGVITTVLALVGGVVSTLAVPPPNNSDSVNAERTEAADGNSVAKKLARSTAGSVLPLSLMFVGIAMGTSCGIYARTHDLLTPGPAEFAARWSGTQLPAEQLQRILLQELYPFAQDGAKSGGSAPGSPDNQSIHSTVLHVVRSNDCQRLRKAMNDRDLRTELKLIFSSSKAAEAIDSFDYGTLQKIRTIVCGE